mmetsp:Transcript_8115/g.12427  ORF Transcript_8115/g.12427 Transcript_8115/m.12427 type:complete len:519 (-) Transcript_8115:137-1693(-)
MDTSNKAAAAARGTLWSIGLRLLSFICTQITLRTVDPVALGKANIDLELVFGFILFLSREGFRLTLAKEWNTQLAKLTRLVHVVVAILVLLWLLLWKNEKEEYSSHNDYRLASCLYCFSAVVEGWVEPLVLRTLFEVELHHKITSEGMATIAKTFITVLALSLLPSNYAITAFGVAQIGYAVVYHLVVRYRIEKLAAENDSSLKVNDRHLCFQVLLFTIQGIFKHILTEGDRILLVLLLQDNAYDKGLYALASAYGGMAARLLFQPLEENARLLWMKLSSKVKNDRGKSKEKTDLQDSFSLLVKFVFYIGLFFAAFGTNYTDVLLRLIMSSANRDRASAAAPVLSAFCVYTLSMALNGTTEAFLYAISTSPRDISVLTLVHFIVGLLSYALLAPWWVGQYGTVGLVAANTVCMILRSLYALFVSYQYFRTITVLRQLLPHPIVLLAFFVAFVTTRWSRQHFLISLETAEEPINWWGAAIKHVSVGIACLVVVISVTILLERSYIRALRSTVHHPKKQD